MRSSRAHLAIWIGGGFTALLIALFVATAWLRINVYDSRSFGVMLIAGQVWVDWSDGRRVIARSWIGWKEPKILLKPGWIFEGDVGAVCLPLWIPAAATGAFTVALWRRTRPRPPGMCARCGYDLRGGSGKCPECGRASDGASSSAG